MCSVSIHNVKTIEINQDSGGESHWIEITGETESGETFDITLYHDGTLECTKAPYMEKPNA